ncbi:MULTISPECIES: hypothetical protein [unclassified Alteromonas]|jgi:hypothetical protein|uniref:hypothetical protein n=1 Tax=unclassified Alteromonas TaxID=2614992 RepID=UPI001EF3983E|nr:MULTISPECIES: hypothetical protein [unclassified Alteromonas]MCG7637725.1 hypothetical protein [Alteromonas sp. CNT1-28]MCG7811786.1 hypothetical protein [Alteromonas sp. MCA-1]
MANARGKASPNAHTQRRLFASSAGYCQNPACSEKLFNEAEGKRFLIAELAHVFAAQDDGPRPNPELSEEERGAFENLIVLCANCHTMVDKASDAFPDSMMKRWKREHEQKLLDLFGIQKLDDRESVRDVVEPLLIENRTVFELYGPHIEEAQNPESGAAEQWKRKVITIIIPNNRKILSFVDANRHLLLDSEKITKERFRQHIDDLEAFHIEDIRQDSSRFPVEMADIYKD